MFFGFDDDQVAFGEAVRDLLDKECPPETVRRAWSAAAGQLDRAVWDHLAEMGVLGMLVAEADGGLGLDELALALVLEETGRAGLPHPVVDTALVAAPLLGDQLAAGTMVATDLGGPNVPCAADTDWLLLAAPRETGTAVGHTPSPGSPSATPGLTSDAHLAVAPTPETPGSWPLRITDPGASLAAPGRALFLVDAAAVELIPLDTVDKGRRAARVGAWSPGEARLVTDEPAAIDRAFDRGAFGAAAQLLGLGRRMLDLTVSYVREREQFGQAIGAFQAVKHHLADGLKDLAFARPAVHRAAHSLAVDAPTRARDVSMAKAMASDAACLVGRKALQCHGAIGYTVEADLHLYMKRTWALARAWGDPAWHRDRVGQALGI